MFKVILLLFITVITWSQNYFHLFTNLSVSLLVLCSNVIHNVCDLGMALSDVSKDKTTNRLVEGNTTQFMKALESVETGLLKHINYLTTVATGNLLTS